MIRDAGQFVTNSCLFSQNPDTAENGSRHSHVGFILFRFDTLDTRVIPTGHGCLCELQKEIGLWTAVKQPRPFLPYSRLTEARRHKYSHGKPDALQPSLVADRPFPHNALHACSAARTTEAVRALNGRRVLVRFVLSYSSRSHSLVHIV